MKNSNSTFLNLTEIWFFAPKINDPFYLNFLNLTEIWIFTPKIWCSIPKKSRKVDLFKVKILQPKNVEKMFKKITIFFLLFLEISSNRDFCEKSWQKWHWNLFHFSRWKLNLTCSTSVIQIKMVNVARISS